MFATLVAATGIAHIFPVTSVEHRQSYHVSLPFFVAAAVHLPTAPLALLVVLVHLAEWARVPQRSWYGQTFNCAVYILSVGLAGVVYHLIWSSNRAVDLSDPACLLAGTAAVIVFGALNRGLVSGVLWLCNGIRPRQQRMLFETEGLFIDTLLLAMGLPLARLGLDASWAMALGAAPVLLIHRALDLPNIRAQARREPQTGLATPAAFRDACELELRRARHFGRPLGLVVLDIEDFERIVAEHGRSSADALLRDAARLLQQSARDYDVPARLDRARFGLLLPETDPAGARAMVRHVRRTITERGFDVASSFDRVGIVLRAGMASAQSEAVSVDELLERAIAALDLSSADEDVHIVADRARPTPPPAPALASRSDAASPTSSQPTKASAPQPVDDDAPRTAGLSRLGKVFVTGVSCLAAALFVWAMTEVTHVDLTALAFLLGLVLLAELLSVQLFDRSSFSISAAPCLAAGMLLGVPGVALVAPVSAIVLGIYKHIAWYKVVFNCSVYVIGGVAATLVYRIIAPPLELTALPVLLVAAALAGLAYYGHSVFVAAIMAIEMRRRLHQVFLEYFQWLWPQYLVLSVMGLFLALGYTHFGVLGASMFALPPLMLRVVSKQYTERTLSNVRQLRELNDQLTHQAFHDSLTGLANRARLTDRVQQALERAARRQQQVVILFIDLDNFKAINDSLGHAAGDQLLVAVSERVRACLRASDTPARLGGDEFAVLLEDVDGPDEAIRVAQRILDSVQMPFGLSQKDVFVNASIGIAVSHLGEVAADELLRNADVAMYAAKEAGKGRYEIFESRLHTAVLERLALEADLRNAIERNELVLHYQPTVCLTSGEISGVEALVRWNHPKRGMVPPLDFISSAESSGLIVPIGRWVLREACRQGREWHRSQPGAEQLSIAVNLSVRQLQEPSIVDDVAEALEWSGLPPELLVLELTESLLMHEADTTVERLWALKALGVRLAIDDFGTGYSSLSYLRRFPVDILKIDRSFVSGVGGGLQDTVLTEAIVGLSRTLRLQVVAEGIEAPAQLEVLRRLGCQFGQGYFFSRPLAVADLEAYLARELPPRVFALAA
jgi:diguanylate cyclase (GGDEF)-like protein